MQVEAEASTWWQGSPSNNAIRGVPLPWARTLPLAWQPCQGRPKARAWGGRDLHCCEVLVQDEWRRRRAP
jgi:hypothetical protein